MSMGLQYINDDRGRATGVFIPIQAWEDLKETYKLPEEVRPTLSTAQEQVLQQRIEAYLAAPDETLAWKEVRHQLEGQGCATL